MINDIENIRKKILFRSWHRGTKEMDLILGEFANNNVSDMDLEDLNKFQEFLNLSDPDLYKWIMTCLLYTSDACRRRLRCRSRWSPYH